MLEVFSLQVKQLSNQMTSLLSVGTEPYIAYTPDDAPAVFAIFDYMKNMYQLQKGEDSFDYFSPQESFWSRGSPKDAL